MGSFGTLACLRPDTITIMDVQMPSNFSLLHYSKSKDTINVNLKEVATQIDQGLMDFLRERDKNKMLCIHQLSDDTITSITPSKDNCQLFLSVSHLKFIQLIPLLSTSVAFF